MAWRSSTRTTTRKPRTTPSTSSATSPSRPPPACSSARFAFGAAGSAGAQIELGTAEQISRGLVGQGKHKLVWRGQPGHMAKDKVKLLLNLVASAITALPRGGEIEVQIAGSLEKPSFLLRCRGTAARPPQYLADYVAGGQPPQLDAMSIQAYYTWRLAASARMRLDIAKDGADIAPDRQVHGLSARAPQPLRTTQGNFNAFPRVGLPGCVAAGRPFRRSTGVLRGPE